MRKSQRVALSPHLRAPIFPIKKENHQSFAQPRSCAEQKDLGTVCLFSVFGEARAERTCAQLWYAHKSGKSPCPILGREDTICYTLKSRELFSALFLTRSGRQSPTAPSNLPTSTLPGECSQANHPAPSSLPLRHANGREQAKIRVDSTLIES